MLSAAFLGFVMLNVLMPNVAMLIVFMLKVVMLNVIMLKVVMLNVVAPIKAIAVVRIPNIQSYKKIRYFLLPGTDRGRFGAKKLRVVGRLIYHSAAAAC